MVTRLVIATVAGVIKFFTPFFVSFSQTTLFSNIFLLSHIRLMGDAGESEVEKKEEESVFSYVCVC